MRRRAFLGLGSNLGDRETHLNDAIERIPDLVRVSSFWETAPVGGPEQGPFLNCVVQLATDRTARQLLAVCREREEYAERVRVERWGPRSLDVDVLWIDGETIDEYDLVVPHPRMFDRAFVLVPLAELAPELIPKDFVTPRTDEVWLYSPNAEPESADDKP